MRRRRVTSASTLLVALASCRPDFAERESIVTTTQILAVRAEPPDAKPGESVTYSALVATPAGEPAAPRASWAFCATPKRLTDNGAVSAACLAGGVRAIADGAGLGGVAAPIPDDACFLFGPEVSSADLRPRDPDVTGGYYQPVRLTVQPDDPSAALVVAFGQTRLRCNVASAAAEVAAEYQRRYVPNQNPVLLPLEASAPLDAVPAGARVTFRAAWPESSVESYVAIDVAEQRVVDRRETMRVSWFATAGTFEHDRTGVPDNAWTAPTERGTVHLFVVLRDDRGGVAFASHPVVVR